MTILAGNRNQVKTGNKSQPKPSRNCNRSRKLQGGGNGANARARDRQIPHAATQDLVSFGF
jgi:hypothetical protein